MAFQAGFFGPQLQVGQQPYPGIPVGNAGCPGIGGPQPFPPGGGGCPGVGGPQPFPFHHHHHHHHHCEDGWSGSPYGGGGEGGWGGVPPWASGFGFNGGQGGINMGGFGSPFGSPYGAPGQGGGCPGAQAPGAGGGCGGAQGGGYGFPSGGFGSPLNFGGGNFGGSPFFGGGNYGGGSGNLFSGEGYSPLSLSNGFSPNFNSPFGSGSYGGNYNYPGQGNGCPGQGDDEYCPPPPPPPSNCCSCDDQSNQMQALGNISTSGDPHNYDGDNNNENIDPNTGGHWPTNEALFVNQDGSEVDERATADNGTVQDVHAGFGLQVGDPNQTTVYERGTDGKVKALGTMGQLGWQNGTNAGINVGNGQTVQVGQTSVTNNGGGSVNIKG